MSSTHARSVFNMFEASQLLPKKIFEKLFFCWRAILLNSRSEKRTTQSSEVKHVYFESDYRDETDPKYVWPFKI